MLLAEDASELTALMDTGSTRRRGEAALRLLAQRRLDLVILDGNIPLP